MSLSMMIPPRPRRRKGQGRPVPPRPRAALNLLLLLLLHPGRRRGPSILHPHHHPRDSATAWIPWDWKIWLLLSSTRWIAVGQSAERVGAHASALLVLVLVLVLLLLRGEEGREEEKEEERRASSQRPRGWRNEPTCHHHHHHHHHETEPEPEPERRERRERGRFRLSHPPLSRALPCRRARLPK